MVHLRKCHCFGSEVPECLRSPSTNVDNIPHKYIKVCVFHTVIFSQESWLHPIYESPRKVLCRRSTEMRGWACLTPGSGGRAVAHSKHINTHTLYVLAQVLGNLLFSGHPERPLNYLSIFILCYSAIMASYYQCENSQYFSQIIYKTVEDLSPTQSHS